MMSREELTYLAVLLGSLPVGFLLKDRGPRWRQFGGAAVGAGLALLTCGPHVLHSLGTVLGTWAILIFLPRYEFGGSLSLLGGPGDLGHPHLPAQVRVWGVLVPFGGSLTHPGVSLTHFGGSWS
uniref:Uncharacterized protein n=1 Tax=Zosterops lateralis melanops TaxID=1220523 RepID=A0A8D2PCA9_ZOSLA